MTPDFSHQDAKHTKTAVTERPENAVLGALGALVVKPKVACLTCTYGRFSLMRECIGFFLAQDYPAKHLFILNNHDVQLSVDSDQCPGVTVLNEPSQEPGIPRNRLLAKVPEDFDFVHTWDDDDAWLPWHLSQAVRQLTMGNHGIHGILGSGKAENSVSSACSVEASAAWKPARSWMHETRSDAWKLNVNNYEASLIVRADYMRRVGYGEKASGNEHRPLLDALRKDGALKTTEVGAKSSYIYTWRGDLSHASAPLGAAQQYGGQLPSLSERDLAWRAKQSDPGDGRTPLTPNMTAVAERYRDLLKHCRAGLSEYEALELAALLDRHCGALAA